MREAMNKKSWAWDSQDSAARFRFGASEHKCECVLHFCIPAANDIVATFKAYFVPIYIPLLLGLGTIRAPKLILNFDTVTLLSLPGNRCLAHIYTKKHLYAEWPPESYYRKAKLRRTHRSFSTLLLRICVT